MANNVSGWLNWAKWLEKLSDKNLMSVILAISIILGTAFLWMPLTSTMLFLFSLYAVGIFATSILLVRYTFRIYFKVKLGKIFTEKTAVNVLIEIGEEAYKIEQDPMLNILPGSIGVDEIAQKLKLSPSRVRYLIQQFRKFNCLKYDHEGYIYGISDYGIDVMYKNKLI